LIDGSARSEIQAFISRDPRFEDICDELKKYSAFVERTQEISSLEYFAFVR